MVRMSVFERTLVDVWLKKMRKMLIATHNFVVHEKGRTIPCKHIKLYVCAVKFNRLHGVLIKKKQNLEVSLSAARIFKLPDHSRTIESLRWLDMVSF